MSDIKISFVVIAYNAENDIERCLQSIINQTLDKKEIIVVDDGSTDRTLLLAEQMKKNYNQMMIIHQKNTGILGARKRGVDNANGKYIFFVDSDDYLAEDIGMRLLAYTDKKGVDIVVSGYYLCNGIEIINKNMHFEEIKGNEYLKRILCQQVVHSAWGKLIKRELLSNSEFMKLPNITMGEDLLINVCLGVCQPLVYVTSECGYFYNSLKGDDSKANSRRILEIIHTMEYIEHILKHHDVYQVNEEAFEFSYCANIFLYYVAGSARTDYKIKKELFTVWQKKKINISKNPYYLVYVENLKITERFVLKLYEKRFFWLPYCGVRMLVKIHDRLCPKE